MADRFPIILNTSANQLQEMPAGDTLDVSGAAVKANLVDSLSVVGTGVSIVGVVTATSFVGSGADINGDLDVDGHTNLDNVSVAGVSTFAGEVHVNGGTIRVTNDDFILGAASGDEIFLTANAGDRVIAGRVNAQTEIFYDNQEKIRTTNTGATVTGTIVATGADINGDLDVDGHTELDNVNVTGVTTFNDNVHFKLNDKLYFGNNNELEIYQQGNNSIIENNDDTFLIRQSGTATNYPLRIHGGSSLELKYYYGNGGQQFLLNGIRGAQTEIYYSGIKKFETTSTGVLITGNNVVSGNVTAVDGTFSGNVSIGGTLTYEDVSNIDSVGIVTARSGLVSPNADIDDFISVGSNIHLGNAGVVTATTFSGSGASLTNLNGSNIASGTVPVARIGTGTKNSSTFYRGDGTFAVVTSVGGNTGVDFNDSVKARFGTGNDLEIFHDGTSSEIKNHVGDSDLNITCTGQGTLTLGVETSSGSNYKGISLHYLGKLEPRVHDSIDLGSSSKRFKNCFFDVVKVDSELKTNTIRNNGSADVFIRNYGATDHIKFRQGASQSDGWNIQTGGHFVPSNNSAYDIGQTSSRVRNGYFTTVSAGSSIAVGTGVTVESNGQATYVGIVTASAFKLSDGSSVGGVESDSQENTLAGTNAGDAIQQYGQRNCFFGFDAGTDLTTGSDNIFIGHRAGEDVTTANSNTIIGSLSGERLTTQNRNTFVGGGAGMETTSPNNVYIGYYSGKNHGSGDGMCIGIGNYSNYYNGGRIANISIGHYALYGNFSHQKEFNLAIGHHALYTSRGDFNIGIGASVGGGSADPAITGTRNTLIGTYAGQNLTSGSDNTIIGDRAGDLIASGTNCIIIGHDADASSTSVSNEITLGDTNITKFRIPGINVTLKDNGGTPTQGHVLTVDGNGEAGFAAGGVTSDGNQNTVGGSNAAGNLATSPDAAIRNTFFGYQAGKSLTTGDENVFIGKDAGETTTVASRFIAIGADAASLGTNPNQGVAIGFEAYKNGSASHTIAIGMEALESVTTSDGNIAVGTQALQNCVTYQNTAIGYRAGKNATSGPRNIAIGVDAMFNSSTSKSLTGDHNIALGYQAAVNIESGTHNLAIGNEAGYSITSGDYCLGIGNQARPGSTGNRNISIGSLSGSNVTTGDDNINIGLFSGYSQTSSNKNITVGREAGRYITSGEENICLGYQAGSSINGGSGNIILGKNADVASAGENNACVIGATTLESFRVPFADFRLVKNSTSDHMILLGTSDSTAAAWSGTRQGIKLVGSQPLMYLVDNGNTSGDDAYVGHAGSALYVAKKGGKVVFQTSASGGNTTGRWSIESTGHMIPFSNGSYDIGSSSYRVRNIYTNDLNLSNKGSTNSVDNTWGDYTIQEGESDLFLINNRSGKKYKFNLTEVS